jgi:sigma-B regulation protein RsbU (phosphoserine phosphatase)
MIPARAKILYPQAAHVPPSPDRLKSKTPTIGVLLDWMGDQYQAGVLRGLAETAADASVNLLCFVGGSLPLDAASSGGRHRVYDLVSSRNVDGIVVLGSTLMHGVGQGVLARRCESYRPLPLCSIGLELDGFPSVTVDNEVGIRGLLQHAIVTHGARRIAFVRGPHANAEADLRLSAYRAALLEHGLAFDERLVVPGTFLLESGIEAVRALSRLEGLKLEELDAIVASNDAMAMGVMTGLEQHGIAVPGQVGVFGFDDIEDARLMQPPVTTVRQPLERLGQEALRIALEWIQHGVAPMGRELATEPVIRRSCGCAHPSGRAGPTPGPERSLGFEAALLMKREHIILDLTRAARGSFAAAGPDWADRLLNALVADLRNPEPRGFVSAFDSVVEQLVARNVDLNLCDEVLGALRSRVVPLLRSDRARSERAEDLFHVCRLATSHAIQRGLIRERLHLGRWSLALNATCTALASSLDADELEARALDRLPQLGIKSCAVAVYEPRSDETARLLFGYDATGASLRPRGTFDRSQLVPNGIAAAEHTSLVVLPLVFRTRNIGHVILALDLGQPFSYGAIADALSVGLRGTAGDPVPKSSRPR